MLKKIILYIARLVRNLTIVAVVVLFVPRLITELYAWLRTYNAETVPTQKVAIVFGAGLTRSGDATPVLKDRVATAAELYFSGKVQKLLMSGDNSTASYNEPEAMLRYALTLGVPESDIVLDYAGRRTYDTCYRAKVIFGVTDAILVTQRFHLPRALFLCNDLGVNATGVIADNFNYHRRSLLFWNLREIPATVTAFSDVVTRPLPILGKPETIFPENVQ